MLVGRVNQVNTCHRQSSDVWTL